MVKVFHITSQYLATTAISFLTSKDDDSHTNFGWKNKALHTHPLNHNNAILSLDYESFSLILKDDLGYKNSVLLDGKSHEEVIYWIQKSTKEAGLTKPYKYKLHYELPYENITEDTIFLKPPRKETEQLITQRDLVQEALEKVLQSNNQNIPIRIWPHHFDSAVYFQYSNEIGIGLGMALPDSIIDDFYLYVSGYKGHNPIDLPISIKIKKGKYYHEDWKGIAMAISGITSEEATTFYQEAIKHYIY
ncbi:hypothetical protein [Ascidiimonas sp. W6]|uniref:hypothetical protein n=1 Tax=Ascidiimonas meishanensis TaxID=3128903 RepID=UPI0030EF5152